MKWYRSWPDGRDTRRMAGRARVEDSLPRLLMHGCDYATVQGGLPDDVPGFCLLEWDIALDVVGRRTFAEVAAAAPHQVLVAPYPIYPAGSDPIIVHKVAANPAKIGHRQPVADGDRWCHSFGWGCIYLPRTVLHAWYFDRGGLPMSDATFSDWHIDRYGQARVTWAVRPQHLHGD